MNRSFSSIARRSSFVFLAGLATSLSFGCSGAPADDAGVAQSEPLVRGLPLPPLVTWATLQGTGGNCLDVQYANPMSTVVDNATCNGTSAQKFSFNTNGTITNYWGYCLDVLGDNTAQGKLDFTTCNGTAAQTWRLDGQQVIGPAGKCLDVFGDNTTSGTVVDLATCNGTQAQVWQVINVPTLLRAVGTKCLDIIDSNTSPGARLQIFECNRGINAQIFTFTAAGEIKNNVGECLDVLYANDTAGQVQMTGCNGSAAQKWIRQGRAIRSVLDGAHSLTGMCLGTVNTFSAGPQAVETSIDHTPVGLVACDGTDDEMWIPNDLFLSGGPATLLVVTSDALASSFTSFLAHKTTIGMSTQLLTMSQIRAAYPAADDAVSVKLAIEHAYRNLGTEYVLLGGDASQVPVRYRGIYDGGGQTRSFIFSDLYYSNLYSGHSPGGGFHGGFDTWDANGNGLFDEQNWDNPPVNPDNVSGFPDVAVARIPAGDATTMGHVLAKIVATEKTNPAYGGAGIPGAGKFGFPSDACYAGSGEAYADAQGMAQQVGATLYGYAEEINGTTGCPAPTVGGFVNDDSKWNKFQAAVNASTFEWLTYIGHGGANAWGYLGTYSSQVSSLTNQYMPLAAAAACETAQFADIYRIEPPSFVPSIYDDTSNESASNIGEMWLANPNGGAAAYVGENVVLEDQPGVDFIASFYREHAAGYGRIGDMWRVAQQAYFEANYASTKYDNHFATPWIYLGIVNLLGDPSMRMQ